MLMGTGGEMTRATDPAGAYSFDPIAPGNWRVEVGSVPGVAFSPSGRDLVLGPGGQAVADFDGRRVGTFQGLLTVKMDATPPHDPFVFEAGPGRNVTLLVDSSGPGAGATITLSDLSADPSPPSDLPPLRGPIAADGGFTLNGSGPIAGIAGVTIVATGRFTGSTLDVEIEVGAGRELPNAEGQPGGDPVVYMFSGAP